jgi:predicted secreted protein
MRGTPATLTTDQAAARRKAVRRTVLLFAIVAVVIYAGFILMGVLSR